MSETNIHCPFCKQEMIRQKSPSFGGLWDCKHCEALFRITQMAFYPIKEGEE